MKKLNITKKQYDESKYFQKKYGALKFMAESKKNVFKTDKGVVIALEGTEMKKEDGFPPPEKAKNDLVAEADGEDEVAIGADEGEVTRGELTEMLKGVVDAVKQVADSQDVPVEDVLGVEDDGKKKDGDEEEEEEEVTTESEEAEGGDADEVVATKEEVADVLAKVIDTVTQVANQANVELPVEVVPVEDDGDKGDTLLGGDDDEDGITIDEGEEEEVCPKCGQPIKKECCKGGACECNGGECKKEEPKMESTRRAKVRKAVRESIRRKVALRKIHESIQKKRNARKVLESLRKKRNAKKVLESMRRRARIRKIMESRKAAAKKADRKVLESCKKPVRKVTLRKTK